VTTGLFTERITIPVINPPINEAIEILFHPKISANLFKVIDPTAKPAKYKLPKSAIRKSLLHS